MCCLIAALKTQVQDVVASSNMRYIISNRDLCVTFKLATADAESIV